MISSLSLRSKFQENFLIQVNNILDAQLTGVFDSEEEAKSILEKSIDSKFLISSS